MAARGPARQTARTAARYHDGFLRHRDFHWARVGALLAAAAVIVRLLDRTRPRAYGGSWSGYVLGVAGAGLILWLAALGIRKRVATQGGGPLKGWTSAHVYLGLALAIVGTLHGGVHLGWSVHALAWLLMMLVIVSGLIGVIAYATVPRHLSDNRGALSERQMLAELHAIDAEIGAAAQGLGHAEAALVQAALDERVFGGLWRRLRRNHHYRATARACRAVAAAPRLDQALERRRVLLARMHRHMHLRALLELWLFAHVPLTIALVAALATHVVAVFFYR